MYKYVSAIVLPKESRSPWLEAELEHTPVRELYERYRKVWLVLTNEVLNEGRDPNDPVTLGLDMDRLRRQLSTRSLTVSQWLASLGNATLPTIPTAPQIDYRTVDYQDAWRAGFNIQLAIIGTHPEVDYPNSEKRDLLMAHPEVDYQEFYRNNLVSVNGHIHRTSYSIHGIYVEDGAVSGRIANDNQVGIWDFSDVGEIDIVPMTDGMIYNPHEGGQLKDSAYVELGVSTEGKSVILVLGGIPHIFDDVYRVIGDGIVKIDFANYPIARRLLEFKQKIDLESLDLVEFEQNPSLLDMSAITSDEAIRRLMKLSQSFIVVVDTPDLYVRTHLLRHTKLPGRYISHIPPRYPLQKADGRYVEHCSYKDGDQWVVCCADNTENYYNFETTGWRALPAVDITRSTTKPMGYSRGYLLEIGRSLG